MIDVDPRDLAARYIGVWNEPDAGTRREAIEKLWAEDGAHILQPSEEIRKTAAWLGFHSTTLEAHGYDAIEARVTRSFEEFVASGQMIFRIRGDAARLRDVVKFGWEPVLAGGEGAGGDRLVVLVLDADGRIKADHMFP